MMQNTDVQLGQRFRSSTGSTWEVLRKPNLPKAQIRFAKDGQGRMVFSYAHPIFWAPFSLIGDGGGGKQARS